MDTDLLKECKGCARRLCPSNFYVGCARCKDCVKDLRAARACQPLDTLALAVVATLVDATAESCAVDREALLSGGGTGKTPLNVRIARGSLARRLRDAGYTIGRVCSIMHLSYRSTMAAIALAGDK